MVVKNFLLIQDFFGRICAAEVEINFFRNIFKADIGVLWLYVIRKQPKSKKGTIFFTSRRIGDSEIFSTVSFEDDLLKILCKFLFRAFSVDNGLRRPLKFPVWFGWTAVFSFLKMQRRWQKLILFVINFYENYLHPASGHIWAGSSPRKGFMKRCRRCSTKHRRVLIFLFRCTRIVSWSMEEKYALFSARHCHVTTLDHK